MARGWSGNGSEVALDFPVSRRVLPETKTLPGMFAGVVPLVLATGAGAEMRRTLGIAVFSGMLGVTAFGIFFTPVFYSVVRKLTERKTGTPGKPAISADVSEPRL